jgi:hypothetical protein
MTASEGFRNLGQFVAAVNVSSNLGLDFVKLKTDMVDEGMSLGQAIQTQRKSLDGTTLATTAEKDAATLISSTEPSTAPTTSSTSTTSTGSTTTTSKAKPKKTRDGR